MNLAIKKAKATGIGWVSAKRSNHFGVASHYSEMAMKEGLLGMAFTNSHPLMVPTRAKEPTLGSNPIACAAPGNNLLNSGINGRFRAMTERIDLFPRNRVFNLKREIY